MTLQAIRSAETEEARSQLDAETSELRVMPGVNPQRGSASGGISTTIS